MCYMYVFALKLKGLKNKHKKIIIFQNVGNMVWIRRIVECNWYRISYICPYLFNQFFLFQSF